MNGGNAGSTGAVTCLLLGAACIACAPIFVRYSELGPGATAFYRMLFSFPVMCLWLLWERRAAGVSGAPTRRQDYLALFLPGLFFAGDLAVWHWSIRLTSVANATLLANFAPIFVTLGAFLIFAERFSKTFLAGMVCAVTGVVILLGDSLTLHHGHLPGDGLGLITAVFYSAYIMAVGRLRSQFSTATIMCWGGWSACLALALITILSGEGFVAVTPRGWLVLLALAMISQVLGQSLIAYALAHLSAAFGAVGLLLQPVLATIYAWLLLQERPSLLQLAGGSVVLLGIYLSRRGA